jgi:hypothetical protein
MCTLLILKEKESCLAANLEKHVNVQLVLANSEEIHVSWLLCFMERIT